MFNSIGCSSSCSCDDGGEDVRELSFGFPMDDHLARTLPGLLANQ
jgi:hypothetical protein